MWSVWAFAKHRVLPVSLSRSHIHEHTRGHGAPAFQAGRIRRLGKPERAALYGLKAALAVQHGRRLAGNPVGVAVFADERVFREIVCYVCGLPGTYLLQPKRIEVKLAEKSHEIGLAFWPCVWSAPVARLIPDVVGADLYVAVCRMDQGRET